MVYTNRTTQALCLMAVAATLAATAAVAFTTVGAAPAVPETAPPPAASQAIPAPTTVAGYRAMFATIDTAQWGAADVSISVRLPDTRRVWLYGDTMSDGGRFVHSTAITQTGGSLHVSEGGGQLLPNDQPVDGRRHIYWIMGARTVGGNVIRVVAAPMSVGSGSVWDFRRRNVRDRAARVRVDAQGDVHFVRWVGYQKAIPPGDDFKVIGPNHFTYGAFKHTIWLQSGRRLVTVCQNWDDDFSNHVNPDGSVQWNDFRPLFRRSR